MELLDFYSHNGMRMTYRTGNIEELSRLEDDFETTARDPRFSPERKLSLLCQTINHMADIVKCAHTNRAQDTHDLAEYVEDFLTRGDLARSFTFAAFDAPSTQTMRKTLDRHMNKTLLELSLYLRPVERYRLEL